MDSALLDKLICITCNNQSLRHEEGVLVCPACGGEIPIDGGIPDYLSVFSIGKFERRNTLPDGRDYDSGITQTAQYRLDRIDKPMLEYAAGPGDVLEIGCGTCRLAKPVEMRGAIYFGIDPAIRSLKYAHDRYDLGRLVRGQGERLPFKDSSFDRIISGYFAYRNVNPDLGLPEARRVLRKDGIFVFDLLNNWVLKLMKFKRIIRSGRLNELFSFRLKPAQNVFEFSTISELNRRAKEARFSIADIRSTPIIPIRIFSFIDLNKSISKFYYRGRRAIYLGYDVIIVLKTL